VTSYIPLLCTSYCHFAWFQSSFEILWRFTREKLYSNYYNWDLKSWVSIPSKRRAPVKCCFRCIIYYLVISSINIKTSINHSSIQIHPVIFLHLSYLGMGQNLLVSIFMGWTSILTQLFCGSLGTRVMTHSHLNPLWVNPIENPHEMPLGGTVAHDARVVAMARWVHRGANPTAGAPCGSRNRLESPMKEMVMFHDF